MVGLTFYPYMRMRMQQKWDDSSSRLLPPHELGNNVFVGTSEGHILHYVLEPEDEDRCWAIGMTLKGVGPDGAVTVLDRRC